MLFKEIKGNNKIKEQLIESVKKNKVAHAQLFLGSRGSSKLAIAIAYAQFLNCNNQLKNDSCGECSSCVKYKTLTHPDLHLIFPIVKTKKVTSDDFVNNFREQVNQNPYLSLDSWIDLLSGKNKTGKQGVIYKEEATSIHKKLSFKNYESKYRIILIWMPEQMNKEVANKLLKTLEEPPSGTIFLLVSENSKKLIKTILSRLQIVKIDDFSTNDIVKYFGSKNLEIDEARKLKNLTDGDLERIIKIINKEIELVDFFEFFSDWLRLAYKKDIVGLSTWIDKISSIGRREQGLFLSYSVKMIRECLIYNFAKKELCKTNKKEKEFIYKFSPFITEENSVLIIEKLEKSLKATQRNANAKILFFELSLKMIKFLKLKRKFVIN